MTIWGYLTVGYVLLLAFALRFGWHASKMKRRIF